MGEGAGDGNRSWQSEDPGEGLRRCKAGADPSALRHPHTEGGVGRDGPGVRDLLKVDGCWGQPSAPPPVNKLLEGAEGLEAQALVW